MLIKIVNIFRNTLFRADLRVLALFRILFGLVMFMDILRRIPYIDIFYSDKGVLPISYLLSSSYKSLPFSLLPAFGSPWEANVFFNAGLVFCLLYIIGYRTKLFQILSTIVLLSIHNKVSLIENGGDTVMNNFMVISLFLPLGAAWSVDAVRKKLKTTRESSPTELNEFTHIPRDKVFSIAFFFCLIQLAMIYFFNFTNKSGGTWSEGTSLHYFFHLDTFLTPIGYWARYHLTDGMKSFMTYMTLFIEASGPILIFFPFFTRWVRWFYFSLFVGFHLCIGLFMEIGMFSWAMIAADVLLFTGAEIDFISNWVKRSCGKPITVVYDSACGFCHQVARILTRLDVYKKITWYGNDWQDHPDKELLNHRQDTILVFFADNPEKMMMKSTAFFHILNKIPFGFIVSWLLIVPGLKQISNAVYGLVAKNRTRISELSGLAACGLPLQKQYKIEPAPNSRLRYYCRKTLRYSAAIALSVLMFANINRAFALNEPFKSDWSLKERPGFRRIIKYLHMNQKWNMFSPNVKKSDSILIIDGITNDGTHLDPLTGQVPLDKDNIDFEKMDLNYGQFMRKYTVRISKRSDSPSMEPLNDWLQRGQYGRRQSQRPRLVSYEIWKVTQSSPKPGAVQRKNNVRLFLKFPDENDRGKKGIKGKKNPVKLGDRLTPTKKKRPPKRRR